MDWRTEQHQHLMAAFKRLQEDHPAFHMELKVRLKSEYADPRPSGPDERDAVFRVLGHERRGGRIRVRVPDQSRIDQVGLVYMRFYDGWRTRDHVRIDGIGDKDGVYRVLGAGPHDELLLEAIDSTEPTHGDTP